MCSVRHSPIALGAEGPRALGVLGRVGVGAHAESAQLVGPAQHPLEALVDLRLHERHVVGRDRPGAAVDRDLVARRAERVSPTRISVDARSISSAEAPHHDGTAHAARHQGGMRRLAALGGEDPARGVEAGDVVGLGERPHEDHVAPVRPRRHGRRGR